MKFFIHRAACAFSLFLAVSCVKNADYEHFDGSVWHTSFHITYKSDKNLNDSILSVMKMVEMSLSPFCDSSTVSAINRNETTHTDSLFRRIFLTAQRINKASGGMYDPTVAPLVELWGFGKNRECPEPTAGQIAEAMRSVGIDKCSLKGSDILKYNENTSFNFSSITKGYGCDLIGEMLKRNGCNDYLVEIGGEMALSGKNSKGDDWHVLIEAPLDENPGTDKIITIAVSSCGIATSGNYRNYRNIESGVRIGHTISPLTGKPVVSTTLSATVIATDAMTADALATACMAMPASLALRMIREWPDAEAMLITIAPSKSRSPWAIHCTENFPQQCSN